jgi:hypothetical protein
VAHLLSSPNWYRSLSLSPLTGRTHRSGSSPSPSRYSRADPAGKISSPPLIPFIPLPFRPQCRTYKSPTSSLQFPSFPRAREAARLRRLHAGASPSARPQTMNSSGSESPASSFWPQTLSLSPVHPLMSFPYSNSQRNDHVDDTRGCRRLQPPSGIATGINRSHRSSTWAHRLLPHAVVNFIIAGGHQIHHQWPRLVATSLKIPETLTPMVSLPQIYYRSSDLNPRVQNRSLNRTGTDRS